MPDMTDRRPLSRVARGLGVALTACVALVMTAPQPLAQARPPIAIVGARIVDGSGNEPFVGTIVIAGGRIAAVGRQTEPPAHRAELLGAALRVPVRGDASVVVAPRGPGLADVVEERREHEEFAPIRVEVVVLGVGGREVGGPQRVHEHVALGMPARILGRLAERAQLGDRVDQALVAQRLRRDGRLARDREERRAEVAVRTAHAPTIPRRWSGG